MASRDSFSVTFAHGNSRNAIRRSESAPMRILVLGDFTGRRSGSRPPAQALAEIRSVDIDNYDHLIATLAPALNLEFDNRGQSPVRLVFRSLEDFHPDRLAEQDSILKELLKIKRQLQNPTTYASAAMDLTNMLRTGRSALQGEVRPPAGDSPSAQDLETDAETLERLFGAREEATTEPGSRPATLVDEMIKRLVVSHVVDDEQSVGPYLEAADAAAGDRLRDLLRHPDFHRQEAAWRSLYELVSHDDSIAVSMLSLNAEELRGAVGTSGPSGDQPSLLRVILETSATAPDVEPFTIIVGDYVFGPDGCDIETLSEIGSICRSLGACFLAGAQPALLGCPDLRNLPEPRDWTRLDKDTASAWNKLRSSPAAQAIGLALPRILLRLPYGNDTDPCDLFAFEEMPSTPIHAAFLWGNPAFVCARLLAHAYGEPYDGHTPPLYADVTDLPAYTELQGSESTMQACAEVYLSEAAGEAIAKAGLIPVLSYQRRNAVRLGPIQTLAQSPIFQDSDAS